MRRDFWRLLAWLLVLSAVFWSALAFRSCDGGAPRPADLEPAAGETDAAAGRPVAGPSPGDPGGAGRQWTDADGRGWA
jgi:hypothetical protein